MKPLFFVLASAVLAAQGATPASQVKLAPTEVAQLDLGKMDGKLVRQLAWSDDQTQIYLQTFNEDKRALPKDVYHYVVPATGGEFKKVSAEPDWAIAYWSWKSGQTAPDDAAFKIEIGTDKRINNATAMPMGGDFARGGGDTGGGGTSVGAVTQAAQGATNDTVYTMHLKNEIVGEFVNHAIMPGLTFGWGPKGTHLIAYADQQGHLVFMDSTGAKQKIEGTKSVVLPAFTADAAKIAYLEGRGRNKYALVVATVGK
jgi:hypothetical protein